MFFTFQVHYTKLDISAFNESKLKFLYLKGWGAGSFVAKILKVNFVAKKAIFVASEFRRENGEFRRKSISSRKW